MPKPARNKAQKKKSDDFKKTKVKLGKLKNTAAGYISGVGNVKAKALVVPVQSISVDKTHIEERTRSRNLTLREILSALRHRAQAPRRDGVNSLAELLKEHPHLLCSNFGTIWRASLHLILDPDDVVRSRLLTVAMPQILSLVLRPSQVTPFGSYLVAYIATGISHIQRPIQADALRLLRLFLDSPVASALHPAEAARLLPYFLSLLRVSANSDISQTMTSSSSYSSVSLSSCGGSGGGIARTTTAAKGGGGKGGSLRSLALFTLSSYLTCFSYQPKNEANDKPESKSGEQHHHQSHHSSLGWPFSIARLPPQVEGLGQVRTPFDPAPLGSTNNNNNKFDVDSHPSSEDAAASSSITAGVDNHSHGHSHKVPLGSSAGGGSGASGFGLSLGQVDSFDSVVAFIDSISGFALELWLENAPLAIEDVAFVRNCEHLDVCRAVVCLLYRALSMLTSDILAAEESKTKCAFFRRFRNTVGDHVFRKYPFCNSSTAPDSDGEDDGEDQDQDQDQEQEQEQEEEKCGGKLRAVDKSARAVVIEINEMGSSILKKISSPLLNNNNNQNSQKKKKPKKKKNLDTKLN